MYLHVRSLLETLHIIVCVYWSTSHQPILLCLTTICPAY